MVRVGGPVRAPPPPPSIPFRTTAPILASPGGFLVRKVRFVF